MKKVRILAVVIILIGLLAGFFVYSSEMKPESRFKFKLGLDLSGGVLLTYKADTTDTPAGDIADSMATLRDVIERRVNLFGVSEPVVQAEESGILGEAGEQRLIVELPGVTDIEEAVRLIGRTPQLDFRILNSELFPETDIGQNDINLDALYTETGLTGKYVKRAQVQFGTGSSGGLSNEPTVVLDFNKEGKDLFAQITKDNIGNVLAIFLDGVPISQPVIRDEIVDGTAVISGAFTPEEAKELVDGLNFGALPLPISLLSTQSIGASLGDKILNSGVNAGMWGFLAIIIFLILWYRLPGVIASVALVIYIIIMFSLFKLIPVTLTAAGIAGFILSIGMAVDANVLIFERLKEELREGNDLEFSIREGFSRAWLSIRDGNMSSLITAVILFWFGTSLVKGFALTFGLGVLMSMISAITVTRVLLLSVAPKNPGKITTFLFGTGLK